MHCVVRYVMRYVVRYVVRCPRARPGASLRGLFEALPLPLLRGRGNAAARPGAAGSPESGRSRLYAGEAALERFPPQHCWGRPGCCKAAAARLERLQITPGATA